MQNQTNQLKTSKGQPNGYAPLDANSKVPVANLPSTVELKTNKNRPNGHLGLGQNGKYDSIRSTRDGVYASIGSVYLSTTSPRTIQATAGSIIHLPTDNLSKGLGYMIKNDSDGVVTIKSNTTTIATLGSTV